MPMLMAHSRKGGEQRKERRQKQRQERRGTAGGDRIVPETVKGEAGASRESIRVRRQKVVHWWRMCQSTGISMRGG